MARKSAKAPEKEPEQTPAEVQAELEQQQLSRTRVLSRQTASRKSRHKNLSQPPTGEAPTGDFISIVTDVLAEHGDLIPLTREPKNREATANNWATILARALRYGAPLDQYGGEGFPFHEKDMEPVPRCSDCQEALLS